MIQDGNLTLAESAAYVEYIIYIYGNGRLALPPSHKNYADYLYWFHFANGTLQLHVLTILRLLHLDKEMAGPVTVRSKERFGKMLTFVDARLKEN